MDPIIEDRLFIGNLTAAQTYSKNGFTHVLSVCPEFTPDGEDDALVHKTINVDDTEYDNILLHLPEACQFIASALEQPSSKVLVHCIMGVSRSPTVVCAYLMKSRNMSSDEAIDFIRQRRTQIFPNPGFRKQLAAFAACGYDPSPDLPAYQAWISEREEEITEFMGNFIETKVVIPHALFTNTHFRDTADDSQVMAQLLMDFKICHIMSISPSQLETETNRSFYQVPYDPEAPLLTIQQAVNYIKTVLSAGRDRNGRVVIHCSDEGRAFLVACAYLVTSRNAEVQKAVDDIRGDAPSPLNSDDVKLLELWRTFQMD